MGAKKAELTVYERFASIADAYPSEVAYSNAEASLSYAELAALAATARGQILAIGPSAPGFVAILTADRVNALVAMLGVAGSGHAYVLLDVNDPDKRLGHILNEVRPFAIMADQALMSRGESLAAIGAGIIDLDSLNPGDEPETAGPALSPDSLVYVSYTSGSTGQPKGVCQTHRNLCFYVDAYISAMEIDARDPISWLFAHGASASNMDIYGALFTGARLCAFEVKDESFAAMARWIDEQGIVLLHTVPTVVRELCGAIGERKVFDSVRVVDLAGEMLFASDVTRMRPHFRADCRILNRLAATEASFISSLEVTSAHEKIEGPLPVGKPPKGVEIGIVRQDGSVADVGESGNIAIASPHICTGYLNRADLDAQAFADVDGRPVWRRYRSADLGFIDEAGNLNFIGRSGSRIKLRGQAVDLAEVEAALYECSGVTGAVVLPRGGSGQEVQEILAYVTGGTDGEHQVGDIRKTLATLLPTYMLPGGYVFLDAFPYTATSKVDRNALAALNLDEVRFRPGYAPPEDEIEERVAAIFSEVLNQPSVGRLDDFFLLGGDSLSLVNLQILATENFGWQFSELHEDATVKGVAAWLRQHATDGEIHTPILLPIRTEGSSPPLFVVHGRRGQAHVGPHFIELLGEDQPLYALQARGLDGKQKPHETLEAMAAEYVRAIKTVQPEGPYFLGGFCAGCYVALEMIRLLHRMGEKFYRPLLIDPPFLNRTQQSDDQCYEEHLLEQMARRAVVGDWNIDIHDTSAVKAAIDVGRAIERALRVYDPNPLPVTSMIIATRERWFVDGNVQHVFGKQAEVFMVDGGHGEMLSPDNQEFAGILKNCLARVRQIDREYRAKMQANRTNRGTVEQRAHLRNRV